MHASKYFIFMLIRCHSLLCVTSPFDFCQPGYPASHPSHEQKWSTWVACISILALVIRINKTRNCSQGSGNIEGFPTQRPLVVAIFEQWILEPFSSSGILFLCVKIKGHNSWDMVGIKILGTLSGFCQRWCFFGVVKIKCVSDGGIKVVVWLGSCLGD